ncbi:DUF222 domain-containing protein [Rathayibacter soli]|uniref:DUF222 domain-containing protein n=1 Tax=Rathayibacter soli TaxID=3144168 RepID=UPI0027E56CBE|nr:DUF222 domain-containing protein [Glaciibacter superstes]
MTLVSQQIREAADAVAGSLAAREADLGGAVSSSEVLSRFDDADLRRFLTDSAALRSGTDALIAAAAGVVAKRSDRQLGYQGLAARSGHRSAAELVQSITGSTKGEAWRQVRLGTAMGEVDDASRLAEPNTADPNSGDANTDDANPDDPVAGVVETVPVVLPWSEPITRAVAEGRLTSEGACAILKGLGTPNKRCDGEMLRQAAEDVIAEAAGDNADDLLKKARWARDRIDPVGVSMRAQERYEARKCTFHRNSRGARTAWIEFDDESAAWVDSVVAARMRPRRGGPRFVDKDEAAKAQQLVEDPRTDDQIVFDLLMDTLRAGTLADPTIAFGTLQPGLRVITTREALDTTDENGNLTGTGFLLETGEAVPPALLERIICDAGSRQIIVDEHGGPLDVGREQRLFTARQKIALWYRDGGCMDPLCGGTSRHLEAHHIDQWHADHGKTDIADGVLLCRFSHMLIHNQGWKIIREGTTYWMIPPPEYDPECKPLRMRSRATWRQQPRTG